jgi:DNA-binding IclR family transcriptional regulator
MGITPRNHSVQKAFSLLTSFRGPDEWVTNAELSRRTGLSEACAHRLMKTLEEIGAVVRNTRGSYRPGMVLASLSKDVAIGDLVRATSQDALVDLAARLKGVVHVGVLENGMVTYAAKVGGPICIPIPSRVGAQQEAYCCALGKVLVAGLDDHQLEEFLHDGKLIALTPQTITSVKELRLEIQAVRQCGYAVDDREVFQTICCVAAPILDPDGRTIAAISLSDTSEHMGIGWRDKVSEALISTAEMVTRKIYPSYGMRPN